MPALRPLPLTDHASQVRNIMTPATDAVMTGRGESRLAHHGERTGERPVRLTATAGSRAATLGLSSPTSRLVEVRQSAEAGR